MKTLSNIVIAAVALTCTTASLSAQKSLEDVPSFDGDVKPTGDTRDPIRFDTDKLGVDIFDREYLDRHLVLNDGETPEEAVKALEEALFTDINGKQTDGSFRASEGVSVMTRTSTDPEDRFGGTWACFGSEQSEFTLTRSIEHTCDAAVSYTHLTLPTILLV